MQAFFFASFCLFFSHMTLKALTSAVITFMQNGEEGVVEK